MPLDRGAADVAELFGDVADLGDPGAVGFEDALVGGVFDALVEPGELAVGAGREGDLEGIEHLADEAARLKDGHVGVVGYEIHFNRYFYRYTPPRPLAQLPQLGLGLGVSWEISRRKCLILGPGVREKRV